MGLQDQLETFETIQHSTANNTSTTTSTTKSTTTSTSTTISATNITPLEIQKQGLQTPYNTTVQQYNTHTTHKHNV